MLCKYIARLVCILCNVILQSHIFKIYKSCIRVKEVLYIFILSKILLVEDKEIVSPILIVCQGKKNFNNHYKCKINSKTLIQSCSFNKLWFS